MQSSGGMNGVDMKDVMKDMAELKATVVAQEQRIAGLEARVAQLEGAGTDEEEVKEDEA